MTTISTASLRKLVPAGYDPMICHHTLLWHFCKVIRAEGADPDLTAEDAGNRTALHMAAYDAHVEVF